MKQYITTFMALCCAYILVAQETVVELSHQPGYSQEVYFNFESGNNYNFDVSSWEIAFLRTGAFEFGERINDGAGIEVYEVSRNPGDYNTVTPGDISGDTPRFYNSDTTWSLGAFDQGGDPSNPMSFGWGIYNPANHHIEGVATFILKYPNGSFKKFMIQEFFSGYTFKYASWDAGSNAWVNEQNVVLPNTQNEGKLFNHYNFSTNQSVVASPDVNNWDLVFQKYTADLEGMMYPVQGALQNPNVTVAVSDNPNATLDELSFSDEINTVGYDWKSFNGQSYDVNSDTYYFLKRENGTVYRFHFLSFEGASTGNFSLGYANVTDQMSVDNFELAHGIKVYPNPATGREVNISFNEDAAEKVELAIYSMTGQKILQKDLVPMGNSIQTLDLSGLSSGVYLLNFVSGNHATTKRLILK